MVFFLDVLFFTYFYPTVKTNFSSFFLHELSFSFYLPYSKNNNSFLLLGWISFNFYLAYSKNIMPFPSTWVDCLSTLIWPRVTDTFPFFNFYLTYSKNNNLFLQHFPRPSCMNFPSIFIWPRIKTFPFISFYFSCS